MTWCWVGYEVLVCPERMHKFRTSSSRKLKLTWVHLEIAVCLLIYKVTYKLQDQNSITSHTHTRLTALFPGLPRWAGTRKVKPIWILLKQETVSGSGISWAICKSAPRSRQITTPAPHHSCLLQAGCPSCRPTNSVKALKEKSMFPPWLELGTFRVWGERDNHYTTEMIRLYYISWQQLSANICANYSSKNPTNTFNLNFNLPALPFSVEELLVWWQKEHLLIKTGTTYTKGFLPQQANEKNWRKCRFIQNWELQWMCW